MVERDQIEIRRSKRKTLGLEVLPDGSVLVRAPLRMPQYVIEKFIIDHEKWIEKHKRKMEIRSFAMQDIRKLSEEEKKELVKKAKRIIPERVEHYAKLIGVSYGRISIRMQKTRWGSCSSKGNLNFNCLLMLTPPEVLDSVIVHELCHIKEMNHSKKFYEEVLNIYPEYYKWNKWLKENGGTLLMSATE